MKKVLYILMSLFLCLSFFEGKAHDDYPFIHINSSNSDLSYDDCRVIFQDSRGFMWFGTYMGLNRNDGKRFTVYDREDLCGVSDFIHTISEDNNGNLWIGTDNGLLMYDYQADVFRIFDQSSDQGTMGKDFFLTTFPKENLRISSSRKESHYCQLISAPLHLTTMAGYGYHCIMPVFIMPTLQ